MNKSDSERITSVLENVGFKKASKIESADLIVVNMCSVRQSAVDRVWGLTQKFRKLKTKNYKLQTVLTGCILKADLRKFRKRFDLILDIKDLPNWPKYISQLFDDRQKVVTGCRDYLEIRPKYQTDFSAFIPISNGCNNFCSYCVVPYTRGPLICRNHKEILKEVKGVVQRNFKEIWLLGQNVNSYGINRRLTQMESPPATTQIDADINFPKLLRMVNNIPGNFWIRFTSSHPKDFSDELIKTMAECEKVTECINLPVQSGDNEILKKMNRPYTVSQYKNLVKKIRKAIPNVYLSADVIVGFPGETKKQFENTVKLFKEIKFDMAYIAEYSPRPQTVAFKMKDDVPQKEKERRRKVLTEVLKETALENNKKYVGKTVDVLVNELRIKNQESGILFGKTRTYKTVKFPILNTKYQILNTNLVGNFIKVKITNALPWGLKGKLL